MHSLLFASCVGVGVATLSNEQQVFFKLVDVCIRTLSMGLNLAAEKGWLGKFKPTQRQIGFCYGFAEEMADYQLNANAIERATFVQIVFNELFGKREASKFISHLINNQSEYEDALALGNCRYVEWTEQGRPPLPPRD
jgi:hypothetical protein